MDACITFDKTAKEKILQIFGLTIDEDNFIVEQTNRSQRVISSNGDEVKLEEFAGIVKGSLIFYKSDLPSLIDLSDRLK